MSPKRPRTSWQVVHRAWTEDDAGAVSTKVLLRPPAATRTLASGIDRDMAIVKQLHTPARAPRSEVTLFIRDHEGLKRVRRDHIVYLHAAGNYVELHTTGQRFVLRTSMRELMHQLGDSAFCLVNRHAAIHLPLLERLGTDSVTVAGHELPVSRLYRNALLERLQVLG